MDLSVLTAINALKKSEIPKQKWIIKYIKLGTLYILTTK